VSYERTIDIELANGIKVQLNQSGRPIERYAVMLLAFVDDEWRTVRVYDNHLGTHHMHRYTRREGKQNSVPFHQGPTNEAIPAAIAHLKAHWEAILASWRS
jgi:hypothetical protein